MGVPGGHSISGRETRRKLSGSPAASASASALFTTSYGTAATRPTVSGVGRSAAKGKIAAMSGSILWR